MIIKNFDAKNQNSFYLKVIHDSIRLRQKSNENKFENV